MQTAVQGITALPVRAQRVSARRTGFAGSAVVAKAAPRAAAARTMTVAASKTFESGWLRADPLVAGLGFVGWTVPSSIPTAALGGNSLFGAFTASIGEEMAKFPTGPALTDNFWFLMIFWHMGLFAVMLFGQIGVNGRKEGYWGQ